MVFIKIKSPMKYYQRTFNKVYKYSFISSYSATHQVLRDD